MRIAASLFVLASMLAVGNIACGKKDEMAEPNTAQNALQPGQPGYVAPQPGQPGYIAPAPQGMAVPGPQALACQADSQCLTHRCNTQYGKCAFPCASDVDCNPGAYCFRGPVPACLPKAPGQP